MYDIDNLFEEDQFQILDEVKTTLQTEIDRLENEQAKRKQYIEKLGMYRNFFLAFTIFMTFVTIYLFIRM